MHGVNESANNLLTHSITSNIAAFKTSLEKELSSRILEKIEERKVEIASELVGEGKTYKDDNKKFVRRDSKKSQKQEKAWAREVEFQKKRSNG